MKLTTRPIARFAGAVLFMAVAFQRASADEADPRLPVPDAASRAPAVAELKKEFKQDLAAKDAESKRSLARKLIERGAATDGDAVKRYVALEQAVAVAEDVHDVRLSLDAVSKLAGAFQVAGPARGFAAVDAIARAAKEPSVVADAASACVDLTGDALAGDDSTTAAKTIAAAKTLAKSAKIGGLAARAAEIETFLPSFRRLSALAGAGDAALAVAADDPAGHEAVGRFECFGRGRWDAGLAHLAKSGNAAVADAAAKDLAHPTDGAARQALADAWWDVAQKEKDPLAKARMLARAASIYDPALAKARLDTITYFAWNHGVALTKDFGKDGPVSLALATIREFIAQQKIDRRSDAWKTKLPHFPEVTFGRGEEYLWRLDTNQGAITMRLFADTAPKHVANFIYLTELGFYDDSIFHRVIPGFMAQGGSSSKTASTGPGYTFATEFIGDRKHDKAGVLSMANTGAPNSDASQFFITFVATPNLDGKHTICGEVIEGMDVVRKLEAQGTPEPGVPKTPLVINTARVSLR